MKTNDLKLGCIADDYTGATDLCSMLVRSGRRVIQCFGVPAADQIDRLADADAIVVALKSRSIAADDAVDQSLRSLRFLQSWGADRFFFKYCSTFDSTPKGNIGQVADALADQLADELPPTSADQASGAVDPSTILFCPAFPENGRTVYCGHLFVGGVLLNESGMRNHPLNPMTDSSLVRVLEPQTKRSVDWISPRDPKKSIAAALIVDGIDEDDLKRTASLANRHRFLTGGSAIAGHWADQIGVSKSGGWHEAEDLQNNDLHWPAVILAGSCSDATGQQVAIFEHDHHVMHLPVDAPEDSESIVATAIDWFQKQIADGQRCVLFASGSDPKMIDAARRRWGETGAAERTELIFSLIAKRLADLGVRRIIVAGGETSGAVINSLGIDAVQIGREIATGVPWVTSLGQSPMRLALKSGNFGGPRFFLDTLETT